MPKSANRQLAPPTHARSLVHGYPSNDVPGRLLDKSIAESRFAELVLEYSAKLGLSVNSEAVLGFESNCPSAEAFQYCLELVRCSWISPLLSFRRKSARQIFRQRLCETLDSLGIEQSKKCHRRSSLVVLLGHPPPPGIGAG